MFIALIILAISQKNVYFVSFHFEANYSFSAFTIQPMSASVLLGETAVFTCAGETDILLWTINGQVQTFPEAAEHGVDILFDNTSFPAVKLNLTIPGTMENDNVSVQCLLILPSNVIVYSSVVFLTVRGKLCIVNK